MASTLAPTTAQSPPDRLAPGDKVTITVLLLSAFVVILNETAMNVALDAIIDDLGITERLAQWLTTGFLLTMAVVIPITGWLQQRLTTRQTYALAMGLFVLGTIIAVAVHELELHSKHPLIVGLAIFALAEAAFFAAAGLFLPGVIDAVGAGWIGVANLLAAAGIGLFLLSGHRPDLWSRVKHALHFA